MSNHLHSVLRNRPDLTAQWSAEEVARRWRRLFPRRREPDGTPAEPSELEIAELLRDLRQLEIYRNRLSSISWFHRCLNQYIACRANAEDDCKGRFWEGRFRSERLETPAAVLACSVYVDLNPIRAGKADTPEESDYTSIQARIMELKGRSPLRIVPKLVPTEDFTHPSLTAIEYLMLVDETGRLTKEDKGSIPQEFASVLIRLKLNPEHWTSMTSKKHLLFKRIIGPVESMRQAAHTMGKRWVHGMKSAEKIFLK